MKLGTPEFTRLQTAIALRRVAFSAARIRGDCDAEAVHQMRVAVRRFQQCLRIFDVFYEKAGRKKIERTLDEMMNLAGEVRGLDIAIRVLGEAGIPAGAAVIRDWKQRRKQASHELERWLQSWGRREPSKKWRSMLKL